VEVEGPNGPNNAEPLETAYFGLELLEDGTSDPLYGLGMYIGSDAVCDPYPGQLQIQDGLRLFLGRELAPNTVQIDGMITSLDQQRVSPVGMAVLTDVALTNVPGNGASIPFEVSGELRGTIDVQLRRVVQETTTNGVVWERTTDEIIGSARGSFVAVHCPGNDRHGFID
jgi:hypothetical protein